MTKNKKEILKTLRTMPLDLALGHLLERAVMLLRGLVMFRKLCFIGKGITLKGKRRIRLGKFVTLHDYCYIDARSIGGVLIEEGCSIGRATYIRSGNMSSHDGFFIMRAGSSCNFNCFLGATGGLEIGRNVLMGPSITVSTEEHLHELRDIDIKEQGIEKKPVKIKENVWIGANVVILGGVEIGTGSIVGAGSVVTRTVSEMDLVVGSPAKSIKK